MIGGRSRSVRPIYQAIIQSVLFFGAETWVLSEVMSRKLEGAHVGLLRRIMKQRSVQQKDGIWRQVEAETVIENTVTQPLGTYIDRSQATVAEWVVLCPILDVCGKETVY